LLARVLRRKRNSQLNQVRTSPSGRRRWCAPLARWCLHEASRQDDWEL